MLLTFLIGSFETGSYMNCQGWMNMSCCLKAYLEYGINLRKGFF
ncbi:hypothetical protein LEP1GSC137_2235 [Leptospira borgpetersenii str. Noumea 25]|uniref:Uncharacterized protein n=1 Tax=Leptospira borgpetersenii serovar Ballum TaxID=280505 RepID=A0A0S2IME2_LEPBO|nr:hypothetical protein LBBP_00431 [Leptospira borgpetersenii serovar Ballum]EKR02072.1 hypothetical protein LEP1GSC121_0731 [Leptospira borgpetersenii serovar Castellonis str. 200801910]EMO08685.1 hypothetical protein LEP1GSC137_2235 [Leptospira borgpetersenii str. Noumea 25]